MCVVASIVCRCVCGGIHCLLFCVLLTKLVVYLSADVLYVNTSLAVCRWCCNQSIC